MNTLKTSLATAGFSMLCALFSSQAAAGAFLSFKGNSTATTGDTVTIDVVVNDLDQADLGAFNLDIRYNAQLLSFNTYTLGTGLLDPTFGVVDGSQGQGSDANGSFVNIAETSGLLDLSAQPDSFVLARLTFNALKAGVNVFSFSALPSDFSDAYANALPMNINSTFSVTTTDAVAVPEPSTSLLLAFGLMGLLGLRRQAL